MKPKDLKAQNPVLYLVHVNTKVKEVILASASTHSFQKFAN